eukprot:2861620-Rhodomonas_salina.1
MLLPVAGQTPCVERISPRGQNAALSPYAHAPACAVLTSCIVLPGKQCDCHPCAPLFLLVLLLLLIIIIILPASCLFVAQHHACIQGCCNTTPPTR